MQGNIDSQRGASETANGKAADGSLRASMLATAAVHAASSSSDAVQRTRPLDNTDARDGQSYSIVLIQPVILLAAIPLTFHRDT
jgi:hypothetical protein